VAKVNRGSKEDWVRKGSESSQGKLRSVSGRENLKNAQRYHDKNGGTKRKGKKIKPGRGGSFIKSANRREAQKEEKGQTIPDHAPVSRAVDTRGPKGRGKWSG